jgi:hypothetical protein
LLRKTPGKRGRLHPMQRTARMLLFFLSYVIMKADPSSETRVKESESKKKTDMSPWEFHV